MGNTEPPGKSTGTLLCVDLRREGLELRGNNYQRGKYMPWIRLNAAYASLCVVEVSFLVRRLVAVAFLGAPASPDLGMDHKDGIKTNNHRSNLESVSPAVNTLRAFRKLKINRLRPAMSKPAVTLRVEAHL